MSDTRSRSASPVREEPKPKKQKTGGFKWKEKKPRDEDSADARDSGRLERGYRDRSPRRDSYRDRDRDRSPRRDKIEDRHRDRERRRETDSYKSREREPDTNRTESKDARPDIDSKFAGYKSKPSNTSTTPTEAKSSDEPPKKKKDKKPRSTAPSEPMILVTVNDRLGTKAQIACLPSDNIKAFKALVAVHIGRQPHEIMLKRQGERPFKDQLTLQDYGVSNGVQLDLELDTGD